MAAEQPGWEFTGIAAVDLSTYQYHAVKVVGWSAMYNGYTINVCAAGQKPVGILQNNDAYQYKACNIMAEGKSKAVIGTTVNAGQSWASDVNGHLVGAVANDWVGGQFLQGGALSATPTGVELTTVLVECKNPWKADAGFTDDYEGRGQ